MNMIKITLPFSKRHFQSEIKARGGKFQADEKIWTLPDNLENQHFADIIRQPLGAPTHEERLNNVLNTCVQLLNALGRREFKIVEAGDRVVLESSPAPIRDEAATAVRPW